MEKRSKWIVVPLIGVMALVVALGLMAFSTGRAADTVFSIQAQDDDGQDQIPWEGGFGGKRGMRGFGRGGKLGFGTFFDYDAFIAEELGVTAAELQAARQAAHEAALDQAVAEGVITSEQAELIKAGQALKEYVDHQEILSQALGIDTDDLEAAREGGKSIQYLLGELGLEPEELKTALQSAYEDAVQQAVDDGVITQSQAEQLQAKDFGRRGFGRQEMGIHRPGGFHFPSPAPSAGSDE